LSTLIMWNLVTLDGFFEGVKTWDLGFHQYAWGDELKQFSIDQLRSADMLLFGRITYDGMAKYWQAAKGEDADYMNSLPKVVFSRSLERADWSNTKLVKGELAAETEELKRERQGNLFVFGSANLSSGLVEHGLFDEYRLAVVPVLLGQGKPLFGSKSDRLRLRLLEARPLSNGCVILRYEPVKGL
jgi:dihydrofolate reductase